ncbi:DMT family transporter [Fictibacillus aquaticus]|uniref:EamA family transporter n=1 Tax=Fictibacillus aquaticus TaxID=2021314 RepID=A0A235F5L7_9BACL|nr:EamA family transporter [Fictibacillus aquaticus]OYD56539.1 EamA family transporter [Fictibacillus aquaticus]
MVLFNYFVMCLIFGTTFLAIKIGVDAGAPPFFSAGSRFFIAGAILFLWMKWRKKTEWRLLLRKEMLISGLALTFGTFSTLYWAEQYVSSGIAGVLSATGPLMIMLWQVILFRQKVPLVAAVGGLIGFCGVVILLLPTLYLEVSGLWLAGCLLILAGEVSYSGGALYSKRVIQRFSDTSPIALNAAQMMYGGALLFVLSSFTEKVDIETFVQPAAWGSLLYLTVAGSMIGHTLFYWLVSKTNPVFPSTWLYISPLIALCLGAAVYNEEVTWISVAGGITIIAGIILVNADAIKSMLSRGKLSLKAKKSA